jgi:uncharacterized membrane protein
VEELFIQAARAAVLLIEGAAVFVVAFGSLEAFVKVLLVMAKPGASLGMRKAIWRRLGVWLLLALEFAWPPTSSAASSHPVGRTSASSEPSPSSGRF